MRKQPLRFYPGQFDMGAAYLNSRAAAQAQKILNRYLKGCEMTSCEDDAEYPSPDRYYRMVPTGKLRPRR